MKLRYEKQLRKEDEGKRYQKNILIISKNFIPNLPIRAYLIKFLTINCLLKNTDNRNAFGIFFCEKLKKFKTNIDKCVYMVYNISTIKKTNKLLEGK